MCVLCIFIMHIKIQTHACTVYVPEKYVMFFIFIYIIKYKYINVLLRPARFDRT